MPWDLAHGRHDSFVKGRLAYRIAYMSHPGRNFRNHTPAQNIEIFRAHCAIPMTIPETLHRGLRSALASHPHQRANSGFLWDILAGSPSFGPFTIFRMLAQV